jgi:multiple sugar transport system ATP-binding protein
VRMAVTGHDPGSGAGSAGDARLVTGLEDVTVVRDGTVALREVTLQAAHGELLVLLGPSGCGKSTALRVMAGLTPVRSGRVVIEGRDVTDVPPEKREVAMVFEYSTLLPFLDVAHNLGWGMKVRHVPKAEAEQRVSDQARALRLTRLLSRKPRNLSAGERSLADIGRALTRVPSVFLLDEPLAHLDAAERSRIRRQIVDLVRGLDVTTLYVTHEQADALAIADRIAVMQDATIVQVDTPQNLYARPANLFVAGFVGTPQIGLLSARVVDSGGSGGFQVGARTLPLWGPLPVELRDRVGQEVVLGLRPEDVYDATDGCDPELVAMPATVVAGEHTGRESLATLELAAPPVTAPGADPWDVRAGRARLRARFSRRTSVRPGSSIPVAVDVARAHVFDPATGRALRHAVR